MPGGFFYQLINKTGSQLNLVATSQNPTNWLLESAPTTIAAGAQPSIGSTVPADAGAIVFGYSIQGSSTVQFWVISSGGGELPAVAQFAPSGHSIGVNITGDSEDGFSIVLTYQ